MKKYFLRETWSRSGAEHNEVWKLKLYRKLDTIGLTYKKLSKAKINNGALHNDSESFLDLSKLRE